MKKTKIDANEFRTNLIDIGYGAHNARRRRPKASSEKAIFEFRSYCHEQPLSIEQKASKPEGVRRRLKLGTRNTGMIHQSRICYIEKIEKYSTYISQRLGAQEERGRGAKTRDLDSGKQKLCADFVL